jgi:hypothetical protein
MIHAEHPTLLRESYFGGIIVNKSRWHKTGLSKHPKVLANALSMKNWGYLT